jgi:hypothetical protein
MASKKIQIAPFGSTTWTTLPGNTGDLMINANLIDDTIFGQNFKSEQSDMIDWNISANAIYKGYAGYQVVIKSTGDPVVITAEPMTLVSGKTYQVTNAVKRLLHVGTTLIVLDNGVAHTADVLSVDYMFGTVTFNTAYAVTGPVTLTGAYLPSSQICSMNKFSMSQSAVAVDQTDLCIAQANSGVKQFEQGLRSVSLDLSGFYKPTSTFFAALQARTVLMIEINPDGAGLATARGFFVTKSDKWSGKAGSLEDEAVQFALNVPDNGLLSSPFAWYFAPTCPLNTAIRTLIAGWQTGDNVQAKYMPNGTAGVRGNAVVSDMSLAGGMGALSEFSVKLTGSGALVTI